MESLKPCPFCGSAAKYTQTDARVVGHGEYANNIGVKCSKCAASVLLDGYAGDREVERQQSAAKTWNKRSLGID